nr:xylulose kinase-1 [Tanacetum cinerariifolium]
MANLTFADTHNMVAFLSKSDASISFDQIMDFLNAQDIQYALIVNPTIYVSCIKQFWATVSIKKLNDVVKLQALIDGKRVVVTEDVIRQALHLDDADGMECLPNDEIFKELARMGYEKPPPNAKRTVWNEFSCSMTSDVICLATDRKFNFSKYIFDSMYTSPTLTQKVFANMRKVGKEFYGVETHLFATMLVQPQPPTAEQEDEEKEVPNAPTPPSPTTAPSLPPQEPIPTSPQAQPATPSPPPHEQPTLPHASTIPLLTTLIETYADEDITLVDAETQVDMDDELQGRIDDVSAAAAKEVNAAEPNMAKRLHDEEVKQAAAREKQEKDNLEKAKVLQQQIKIILEIIRVGRIIEAYQSFEDMLKTFDREDLVALWRLVKEKFSTSVPTVDKEKALWVELKRLFEPDTEDVMWKLQRYMHYPIAWKFHSNCEVYQVSSTTRRHDMYMLTEKHYLLLNGVMTLMLSTKLQVEEDSEMARDLVMKIFMKGNQPKSRSLDTSFK